MSSYVKALEHVYDIAVQIAEQDDLFEAEDQEALELALFEVEKHRSEAE